MVSKEIPRMDVRMAGQLGRLLEVAYTIPSQDYKQAVRDFGDLSAASKAVEQLMEEQKFGGSIISGVTAGIAPMSIPSQLLVLMPLFRNIVIMVEALADKPIEDMTQQELRQVMADDVLHFDKRRQAARRVADKYELNDVKADLGKLDRMRERVAAGELSSEKVAQCRICSRFLTCPNSPLNGGTGHTSREEVEDILEAPEVIHNLFDIIFGDGKPPEQE